jgi:hypothetical protein
MAQVRVQFFTTLEGELTREAFTAGGDAEWTTDPPLTVNSSVPSEGVARVGNRGVVDCTYYWMNDRVTYFVFVTNTNGVVTARASANKEGHSATANVSGGPDNWVVGVNFR